MPDNLQNLADRIYAPVQPTQPTIAPPDNRISGWQHKTGGIAQLAVNFLAGASKGRAQAYDQQQQQNVQQARAIETAIAAVDASGASEEVKTQQKQELLKVMGEMARGAVSDSGSTKSGQGGDPNAAGAQHPALGAMKHVLDSLLGPAPKKGAITPEAINATLGKVFSTINDPKNLADTQQKQAEQTLSSAWAEAVKANGGKPLTSSQIAANQQLTGVIAQYNKVYGGKAGPTLTAIGSAVDTADKQAAEQSDPEYKARLEHTRALTDSLKNKGVKLYQAGNGDTISFNENTGKYYDAGGNEISGDDPRLKNITTISAKKAATHLLTKQGDDGYVYKFDPIDGHAMGRLMVTDASGKEIPFKATSPLGRMFLQQGFVDEKDMRDRVTSINEHYSAEMKSVETQKDTSKKQIDEEKAAIQKRWDDDLGIATKPVTGKKTGPPPKQGSYAPFVGKTSADTVKGLLDFLKAQKPTSSTQQPPPQNASPQAQSWANQ